MTGSKDMDEFLDWMMEDNTMYGDAMETFARRLFDQPEQRERRELAMRLRNAIVEGESDTTTVEGWLRIIDRAGLKLVQKSVKVDYTDDILAQGWEVVAHDVRNNCISGDVTHTWVFHSRERGRVVTGMAANNADALDQVRRKIEWLEVES